MVCLKINYTQWYWYRSTFMGCTYSKIHFLVLMENYLMETIYSTAATFFQICQLSTLDY